MSTLQKLIRSSLEKGGSCATLCLAKTHTSRMLFAIWYPRSDRVKNRVNRCGETLANAASLYVPARAFSIAVSLISVAKISTGALNFASSRNSDRQLDHVG